VLQFNKELDFFATPLKKSIPTALCSQTQARKKMKALLCNAFIFFLARLIGISVTLLSQPLELVYSLPVKN
jgi:hypothetical protein